MTVSGPASGPPVRNWAGNTEFSAHRVQRPESVEELQHIVGAAHRVRALGTGHSFNRVADTRGDLVRLDCLPPVVDVDPEGSTVTVGAGMPYSEVTAVLHASGHALANLASLPHISVAGCCATGTHGSGDSERCLAAAVTEIELIGADGELSRLSRRSDPERFPGSVVALGALGIVTRLTLRVEPAFEVTQHIYTGVRLTELAARFDEIYGCAYSVSAFTDYRSGEARVWVKRRTTERDGRVRPPGWTGETPADEAHHPIPGIPATHCTQQLGVPGPWFERLPHFRPEFTPSSGDELQSEVLLPRAAAPEALEALRSLGERVAPVLRISEVRTVAADDLWLSPASGRDCVAFHFTWVKDPGAVLPVVAAVEEKLLPLGARPHWGKLTAMEPERIASLYERAADFRQLVRERDPRRVFANDFVDEVFGLG
ncbi:FAD-binding protein [Streptomyces abyssalis]|uniref:FAD-binding protein n=1 Tax=Streptomyces abyssalis TaxID=933944 RepID=A0A1E7JSN7_9ACTN|nr:FAD-binding protein [Streptomyces abyssalis]OEU91915.1 FAD-binding protein [Streptomyces abyssalis]OEU93942.1 FAD-binding protein [Streptomyces abyssalis]